MHATMPIKAVRRTILAGLMIATAAIPAAALADVKAGVDAWSRGDYAAAVREWQGPAEKGDADALFNLAQAYKLGRGVKPDLAKAEELFSRAAARGHLQAADMYGLLVFQAGDHARAMPFIKAAAERGDPRAQYLLGIAHFNADNVPRDWVRAYALVTLARQAGLPQATAALAQMDKHIALEDRQQSVALAAQLAAEAAATRTHQLAAADLGVSDPGARIALPPPRTADPNQSMGTPATREAAVTPEMAASAAAYERSGRESAGADFTRPKVPALSGMLDQASTPAAPTPAPAVRIAPPRPVTPRPVAAAPVRAPKPAPVPTPVPAQASRAATGDWRVQLGAFGVAGNADKLWAKVRARPELAGHSRRDEPAGRLTKLMAGGFASQAEAQAACTRLSAAGFACLAVRD